MLKLPFFPIFFLVLTTFACASSGLPLWDLSTDSGVLSAYNTITERQIPLSDFCVHRPPGLEEVVVIGMMTTERGCDGDEIFVEQTLGNFNRLTDEGLAINGWDDPANREELARLWVEGVLLAWHTPVLTENEDFATAGKEFTAPDVRTLSDGSVQVDMWAREPAGALAQINYVRIRVAITSFGTLGERTVVDSFAVPMEE